MRDEEPILARFVPPAVTQLDSSDDAAASIGG